jgi:predicted metal-binding protein
MDRTDKHIITICTSCRQHEQDCCLGHDLIRRLRAALDTSVDVTGNAFAVEGFACLAACNRPCTVAYRATAKTVWLFGDVDPDADIDDLVAFAGQYAASEEGWFKSADRLGKLRRTALARVPSLMIRSNRKQLQ